MGTRVPILMYHSIGANDVADVPEGWSRFHTVPYSSFCAQLDLLIERGHTAIRFDSLGLAHASARPIGITFDDGHSSDIIAAEALHSRGLHAIFFITWSNIGRPDCLTPRDVGTLDQMGFEIGSHAMTHVNLTNESPADLSRQLLESKARLENLMRKEVSVLAVPFGRYNSDVIEAALAAGYRRVMTSDFSYANLDDATVMPRLGITSETTLEEFEMILKAGRFDIARRRIRLAINRRVQNLFSHSAASPAVKSKRNVFDAAS